jgi:hypothetical protein
MALLTGRGRTDRRRLLARVLTSALTLALLGTAPTTAQQSPPEEKGSLREGIERRLADIESGKTPIPPGATKTPDGVTLRFETSIEVRGRTPEELLSRYLDLERLHEGATSGPPLPHETRDFRPSPAESVDLLGFLKWLGDKVGSKEPRYFVYEASGPRGRWRWLREGPLPPETLPPPGLAFELVGAFPDLSEARRVCDELPPPPPTAAGVEAQPGDPG